MDCKVDDCSRDAVRRGWCNSHYNKWWRYGDPLAERKRGSPFKKEPSYAAAHNRIKKAKGPASDHKCLDCDEPAENWSFMYSDPDALFCPKRKCWYSGDPDHYAPMCMLHHRLWDTNQRLTVQHMDTYDGSST